MSHAAQTAPTTFPADAKFSELIKSAIANAEMRVNSARALVSHYPTEANSAALAEAEEMMATVQRQIKLAEQFTNFLSLARDVSEECQQGEWLAVLGKRAAVLMGRVAA